MSSRLDGGRFGPKQTEPLVDGTVTEAFGDGWVITPEAPWLKPVFVRREQVDDELRVGDEIEFAYPEPEEQQAILLTRVRRTDG